MHKARKPLETCGKSRGRCHLLGGAAPARGYLRLLIVPFLFALAGAVTAMQPGQALAQSSAFPQTPGGIFGQTPKSPDKAQPLYLQGDELLFDTKNNLVTARGNVEIIYNDYVLTAQEVIYDRNARTLTARGDAKLKDPNGNITSGELFTLTDDFSDAFAESLSVVAKDKSRITARTAIRRDGQVTEFTDGKFTPCQSKPGSPPLWCIGAKRIVHDEAKATITYQDAHFDLLGVPVLYLPYFEHPDPTVKRRSGFLMPGFGQSETLGFAVEVPYHFALDPSYDFLFNPVYLSEQGVLYQGTWRQKIFNGQYHVKFSAIDQQRNEQAGTDFADEGWRGSVESIGKFKLSSWWTFGWDATIESDDGFRRTYKLDNVLQTDRISTAYLEGLGDRNYFSMRAYHFGGLLLQDDPRAESVVHPVIDWNYLVDAVLGGELSFNANVLSLSRSDGNVAIGEPDGVDSNHVVAEVKWRRKLIDPIGQEWTPFGELRGDVYNFRNMPNPDNPTTALPNDTFTRAMATGGVTYAYPFIASNDWSSHIIEPIGQIIVRPATVRQRTLPDEDAKSLVLDDTLLFDTDKFSGYDRLETGTRANVGFQYTFQAYKGGYARAIIGQSFHIAGDNAFRDPGREVDKNENTSTAFSAFSGLETDRSDYVAGLYLAPSDNFRIIAQARFDDDNFQLQRQDLFAYASFGPVTGQVAYAYNRNNSAVGVGTSQQDLTASLGLKLTEHWSLLGTMRYDVDEERLLADSLQIKYADECTVLAFTYTETYIDNPKLGIESDRSLMVRFSLKHIGDFQTRADALTSVFFEDPQGN